MVCLMTPTSRARMRCSVDADAGVAHEESHSLGRRHVQQVREAAAAGDTRNSRISHRFLITSRRYKTASSAAKLHTGEFCWRKKK